MVMDNRINNIQQSDGLGIQVWRVNTSLIYNNTILNAARDGINIYYSSNLTIQKNNIHEHNRYGIWLYRCEDKDNDIKLITGYVEGFKFGPQFVKLAKQITPRKPIILWKGGTTPQGSQATASHTGSLAVPKELWEGLIRQTGIIPADSLNDLINLCRASLWEALPQGPGVCLMSPGGGCSVSMTDAAVNAGLEVPPFPPSVRSELSKLIAKVNTMIHNPIDFGASSYLPQTVKDTVLAVSRDPNIHAFVYYHFVYPYEGAGLRERSGEILDALSDARQCIDKPVYVALYSPFGDIPEVDEARREVKGMLNDLQIPYAANLDGCIKAVGRMWDYSRYLKTRKGAMSN